MRTGAGALARGWGLLFLAGTWTTPVVRAAAPPPLWREVTDSGLPANGKTFGGVWADCDGDGALDLILSRHGDSPEVWLDRGLRFVAAGGTALVVWPAGLGDQHGAAACDFDGDGLWDIYATVGADHGRGRGSNRLWRQDPPGVLSDAVGPDDLLADPTGRGRGALWLDLDGDGTPELLVLNYATPPRLFHHRYGGAWDDWSSRLNLTRPYPGGGASRTFAAWFTVAAAGDLDGDGRTDLVLAGEEFAVLRGDGAGGLADVTEACGFRFVQPPLGHLALGDVDNDGDFDLLLACRGGQLQLWLNRPDALGAHFTFGPDLSALRPDGELRSVLLADFDNDGLLDLYVARQNPPGASPGNLAARGLGDGRFISAPAWGGAPPGTSATHGASAVDLDRDGDLDLVLFNGDGEQVRASGAVLLYENTTPVGRGLSLDLVPLRGPPHALGARVALHGRARGQFRQVQCVATPFNGSILPLHFGVGDDPGPYEVVIDWPDGIRQEVRLPVAGRFYLLRETQPAAQTLAALWPEP
jgi:hypothetical protein